MHTVDVVLMKSGYHVTRRYGGMNQGSKFFAFETKTKTGKIKDVRTTAEKDKDKYVKEWMRMGN